jgi:hypothetical protein
MMLSLQGRVSLVWRLVLCIILFRALVWLCRRLLCATESWPRWFREISHLESLLNDGCTEGCVGGTLCGGCWLGGGRTVTGLCLELGFGAGFVAGSQLLACPGARMMQFISLLFCIAFLDPAMLFGERH